MEDIIQVHATLDLGDLALPYSWARKFLCHLGHHHPDLSARILAHIYGQREF